MDSWTIGQLDSWTAVLCELCAPVLERRGLRGTNVLSDVKYGEVATGS